MFHKQMENSFFKLTECSILIVYMDTVHVHVLSVTKNLT